MPHDKRHNGWTNWNMANFASGLQMNKTSTIKRRIVDFFAHRAGFNQTVCFLSRYVSEWDSRHGLSGRNGGCKLARNHATFERMERLINEHTWNKQNSSKRGSPCMTSDRSNPQAIVSHVPRYKWRWISYKKTSTYDPQPRRELGHG